ncbi:hypothetical protein LTS08_000003 [Lithohypha guttulata]|uniref:HMA domain-containing protein n=1 Tax=Lithohypha guttulata TaxID=1690604 RepID=A0AAN7PHD8_9EURO|nr:hypothetical protein LTR05_008687 [Lithohypha guttulata]KAK5105889.1 hypothetical protein LTS08_000003 [Lithohypha guttulata]
MASAVSSANGIRNVDVSIIDHAIRIQHEVDISRRFTDELVKAAFEVQHISTCDASGRQLHTRDVPHEPTKPTSYHLWPVFMSRAQRKHIENCNACQSERQKYSIKHRTWSALTQARRRGQASVDVSALERGESQLHTPVGNRSSLALTNGTSSLEKDEAKVYIATISIEGMTCASCSGTITAELEQMDIVQHVGVNLLSNSATVTFSGPSSNADNIVEAIEDVGYEATIDDVQAAVSPNDSNHFYKASLSIEGMTCGSCVGTITRGLQDLPDVQEVNVDLVGDGATVGFKNWSTVDSILTKIGDLGYGATVVDFEELYAKEQGRASHERSVQFQISGMYCPNCPINIASAIHGAFGDDVLISEHPSLKNPRITLAYRPNPPTLTIRRLLSVINAVDAAWSATVYHPPSVEERSRTLQRKERDRILRHLFLTFLVAIPSFIIGVVYMSLVSEENGTRRWFEEPIWSGTTMRMEWSLFIMTTPAMFYGASIFHARALKEIWSLWRPKSKVSFLRRLYRFGSMNLLISAGTSVAYFASLAVLIMEATASQPIDTHHDMDNRRKSMTYFDTVTFLTFFILIGRFLEAYSKAKTGDAVAMLSGLRPTEALLLDDSFDENGPEYKPATRKVPVSVLEVGDNVVILHGASPPTDGILEQDGTFVFDESSLTGESKPVKKIRGDTIFTGSVNVSDPVKITVTELGGKSMLDQIVAVVRDGQAKRAPIERVADLLTGYFVPAITMLAIVTWIVWLALGTSGRLPADWLDADQGGWAFWSVEFAIAVFVVACPCGIGLAAPTALFVGGGLAAKSGILVQGGGEAFQEASQLDAIVFDKTGTLTEGQMMVTDVQFLDEKKAVLLQHLVFALTKAMEESSTHPIARAVADYCSQHGADRPEVVIKSAEIKEMPGQGMTGRFVLQDPSSPTDTAYEAAIGNGRLLSTLSPSVTEHSQVSATNLYLSQILARLQSTGFSTAIFCWRKLPLDALSDTSCAAASPFVPITVFGISDPIRQEAQTVLQALRDSGVDVHMCTGDNQTTAQAIASQLSIPVSNVRAGIMPQGKASYIRELQSLGQSSRRRIIAFVGDGTNDTPALSAADVSIALSSGSDVAVTTASFILLNSSLQTIPELVKLAKRVFLRVKLNFAWAAVYNICLIPVAAGVFFPISQWRLSPVWASAAMAGSSVSVVLSSLALKLPELEWMKVKGLFARNEHVG